MDIWIGIKSSMNLKIYCKLRRRKDKRKKNTIQIAFLTSGLIHRTEKNLKRIAVAGGAD